MHTAATSLTARHVTTREPEAPLSVGCPLYPPGFLGISVLSRSCKSPGQVGWFLAALHVSLSSGRVIKSICIHLIDETKMFGMKASFDPFQTSDAWPWPRLSDFSPKPGLRVGTGALRSWLNAQSRAELAACFRQQDLASIWVSEPRPKKCFLLSL